MGDQNTRPVQPRHLHLRRHVRVQRRRGDGSRRRLALRERLQHEPGQVGGVAPVDGRGPKQVPVQVQPVLTPLQPARPDPVRMGSRTRSVHPTRLFA